MKHHDQKRLGGGKDLFGLKIMSHGPLREAKAGTQNKNLEAGADAEVMEGCCLLACLSWLA